MTTESRFELSAAKELRAKYGLVGTNAPAITLDRSKIPKPLWELIPLAETWGISDDLMRADFVAKAGREALATLTATITPFEDALDEWLAGPEAQSRTPSNEYIAFSCMRMASDGV